MPKTSQSILINSPIEYVHRIVTNFEHYPDYFPEVREAHVMRHSKNHADVHFVFHVVTTINCYLKFTMTKTEIKWVLIKGDFMVSNDGEWKLEAKGKNMTRATYQLQIEPSRWVPSTIIEELIVKNAPNMLMHLKERCEAHARAVKKAKAAKK